MNNLQPESLSLVQHQRVMTHHLRDPQGHCAPPQVSDRRVGIYRELVFNNIESLLSSAFPVIVSLLSRDQWLALVREFVKDYRAQTPYFTQLSAEFVAFLAERGVADDEPPCLVELAHYERVELDLYMQDRLTGDQRLPEGSLLDECLGLASAALPLAYAYPVHQIRPDVCFDAPPSSPTLLLLFQDANEEVRFFELQPFSYQLVVKLASNGQDGRPPSTTRALLLDMADQAGVSDRDWFLQQAQGLLQRLNALQVFTLLS